MGAGLSGGIVTSMLNALVSPFQDWLSQHPQVSWLLANPGWLLVVIFVVAFLLLGLLQAVASLTEKFWLGLLKLPILCVRWIWRAGIFLLRRPFATQPKAMQSSLRVQPHLASVSSSNRLAEVLNRLEVLQREQDELMQEVRLLLADNVLGENVLAENVSAEGLVDRKES
jgi:hypothetical protein